MVSIFTLKKTTTRLIAMVITVLATLTLSGYALAAAGPWQGSDVFEARLITVSDAVGFEGEIRAGLDVVLKKGWKIYWRSPGDAGLPPELDFSSSSAIISHHMDFPAPYRFTILGFESYGYKDRVIFPLTLMLTNPGRGVTAVAHLSGLVCDDVCIPVSETLTLSLPEGPATPSAEAHSIAQAVSMVPRLSTAKGITIDQVAVDQDMLKIKFTQDGLTTELLDGDVFIEGPFDEGVAGYSFAKPRIYPDHIAMTISGADPQLLEGHVLTVTVVTQDWLLEEEVVATTNASEFGRDFGGGIWTGLLVMIAIAFMGGVILNVMPCVLPVISLKLAQVVGMGGQDKCIIRLSFLATATGVVTSFLMLGVALLILRHGGVAIGWGIQFQNIYFLSIASGAIIIFGLTMLDVITIPMPQGLQKIGRGGGLIGDFLTGFMATVLATPCSAPFVGTALTFALTAPATTLVLIFLAMGLGLASPWMMVAAAPGLAVRIPRPGPWLITLKRVLSLGLFGTALWLISIIITISSDTTITDGRWQSWSLEKVETLIDNEQVVFVDVTAAWCLTCKANKALVLDSKKMIEDFDVSGVVLLRADWTKPAPAISAYLADHDRFGIPFNIIYGPSAPKGIVLPELLSIDVIQNALNTAGK